jgi:hypothetical protein
LSPQHGKGLGKLRIMMVVLSCRVVHVLVESAMELLLLVAYVSYSLAKLMIASSRE